jgi:DNA-binding Lrp family transcriptional regulator
MSVLVERAYILIKAQPNFQKKIVKLLATKPFVINVDLVFGTYDITVMVEAENNFELGRIVLEEVAALEGIDETVTLIAIHLPVS